MKDKRSPYQIVIFINNWGNGRFNSLLASTMIDDGAIFRQNA